MISKQILKNMPKKTELSAIIEFISNHLEGRCCLWCPCGFEDGTVMDKKQLLKHLRHIIYYGRTKEF